MQYEKMTKAQLIGILRDRHDVADDSEDSVPTGILQSPCGGKSSDNYHCLLNDFPALVWRSGTDAKCNFFNLNWLEFTGRSLEQETGDGWAEGVHPDDFDACLVCYLSAFNARRPFEMEYRLRRHDGEYRWILDIGRVLQTPDGKFSGYLGACFDITERKRSEEVLLLNQEQLKCMAGELLQAEERERKRIASDLHDRIGQNLILSKIRLKRLTGELNGRAAALLIDDIVKLIDDSIQQVRSLTFQISPPLLYEVGLEVAVESLADRFFEDHGLKVDIRVNYESLLLGENLRVTLYQMVRELLLNIVKHVAPRDVLIVFDKSDSLSIMVQDNGIGFNVEEVMSVKKSSKGYGLYNIKQNLELVNGSMTIDSSIGRGTRVVLNVPL